MNAPVTIKIEDTVAQLSEYRLLTQTLEYMCKTASIANNYLRKLFLLCLSPILFLVFCLLLPLCQR